jgi:hypothetical protein
MEETHSIEQVFPDGMLSRQSQRRRAPPIASWPCPACPAAMLLLRGGGFWPAIREHFTAGELMSLGPGQSRALGQPVSASRSAGRSLPGNPYSGAKLAPLVSRGRRALAQISADIGLLIMLRNLISGRTMKFHTFFRA